MEKAVASGTTTIPCWNAELVWDVDGFENMLNFSSIRRLESPILEVTHEESGKRLDWRIRLHTVDKTKLDIFLDLYGGTSADNIDCCYELRLGEPGNGIAIYKGKERYLGRVSGEANWTTIYFDPPKSNVAIPLAEVTEQFDKLCPQGILRITVALTILLPTRYKPSARTLVNSKLAPSPSLHAWTASLYNESLYSDVVITCQEREFPCHKFVLGQSSVFAAMFASEMKEAISKEIIITDVSQDIFELFLRYLYSKDLHFPTNHKELLELLYCAEKYDVRSLKDCCFYKMTAMLSDENAGELNLAAYMYSQDEQVQGFYRNYCLRRQSILMKNPDYRRLFLDNVNAFL